MSNCVHYIIVTRDSRKSRLTNHNYVKIDVQNQIIADQSSFFYRKNIPQFTVSKSTTHVTLPNARWRCLARCNRQLAAPVTCPPRCPHHATYWLSPALWHLVTPALARAHGLFVNIQIWWIWQPVLIAPWTLSRRNTKCVFLLNVFFISSVDFHILRFYNILQPRILQCKRYKLVRQKCNNDLSL